MRELRSRLSRVERLLPDILEKRRKCRAQLSESLHTMARSHATAVAALVLYGEPKIDEQLLQTWTRTLTSPYKQAFDRLRAVNRVSCNVQRDQGVPMEDLEDHEEGISAIEANAFQRVMLESSVGCYTQVPHWMHSVVMNGAEDEASRFSEIFKTAPIWLLKFTFIFLDAKLLKFDVPHLSVAPEFGEIGLRDTWRWPLLPVGVLTEGDPVPAQEPNSSLSAVDYTFLLEVLAKPESEWTRTDHRRMRALDRNRELEGPAPDDVLTDQFAVRRFKGAHRLEHLRTKALHGLFKRLANPDISASMLHEIISSLTNGGKIDKHGLFFQQLTGMGPRPDHHKEAASVDVYSPKVMKAAQAIADWCEMAKRLRDHLSKKNIVPKDLKDPIEHVDASTLEEILGKNF